ncbi:unnamed protein product [Adineta steineri]|uniref:Uncharacterized protein n=1 Tax=Adineta steineri TaxID=433720 RepID=A0A820GN03_9BILA|nr:unnamed protein product [Adineta steineri]CAF0870782.1 unnamed protein product [Adineta steineri]CAF0889202.1 unnamed protein product [Adineta steineri]CAF4281934.1 unnamed protein product [Adineta steineri]
MLSMNLINWSDEWRLLLETIKRQDFEHVLEKSNRQDLLLTVKCVAMTSIGTTFGALIGGPLGALAGATTATMISYGANVRYKSIYELIKQLSIEEKYRLLTKIKAVLGGIFNEQTIILSAVVVAKEIYRFFSDIKGTTNDILSSSNNSIIIEDFNE